MKNIKMKAHAKINLTLDVMNRRPDGYHEVSMVMQGILLHDVVNIKRSNDGITRLVCNIAELGASEDNLAYRAARLLAADFPHAGSVEIQLEKRIPIAAGLGGGSSDAATVLLGLNKMFDLKLSLQTLIEYARQLGSDVPFCLRPLIALAEGRGDILTPWNEYPVLNLVLFKPPFGVSTKKSYDNLHRVRIEKRPSWQNLAWALRNDKTEAVIDAMGNVLEFSTFDLHPKLRDFSLELAELGFKKVMMSGSGPTLLGFADSETQAHTLAKRWERTGWDVIITRTLTREDLAEEWID